MMNLIMEPWPWYVGGVAISLMIPLMLISVNKSFGVSKSMMHVCAACIPTKNPFFNYDWKKEGLWSLMFVLGILIGGFLAGQYLSAPYEVAISETTKTELQALGINSFEGLVPVEVFNWSNLGSIPGLIMMVLGGFLIGFGSRYAGGCTSGHSIMGMSLLSPASLLATVGFFIGGLITTHLFFPQIFNLFQL